MVVNLLQNSRVPFTGMDDFGTGGVTPPVQLPGMTSAGMNQAVQPFNNPQPSVAEIAPTNNALGETLRRPRVTDVERNPSKPLEENVRPRPKWYDVVGRIGDIMALMGDRDPLYAMFTGQEREAERQAAQQQAIGAFLQDPQNEDNFKALFKFLPPEQAQKLRAALTPKAPEPVKLGSGDRLLMPDGQGGFKEVVGADRTTGVSPSAQIQLEQRIRDTLGDAAANRFLESQIGPQGMSEYQAAMVSLALQRLALDTKKFANRPPSAAELKAETARVEAERTANALTEQVGGFVAEMRDAGARLARAGGMSGPGSTPGQAVVAAAFENVPLLERVANQPGFQARQEIETLVNQMLPNLVSFMGGLKVGGKNLDSQGELKFWQNTFSAAKDKGAFDAVLRRFETRMEQVRREAFRQAQAPSAARPAAPARQAPAQRSTNAPTRREGAPRRARTVNGRLVFE